MSKYIDADKLIAEIEKKINQLNEGWKNKQIFPTAVTQGRLVALREILDTIDSLKQEQMEPSNNLVDVDAVREDFMAEVYRVLDADTTNDRANAIIDAFDSLPTVTQEQPEADLEKEIDSFFPESYFETAINFEDVVDVARHFAKWGAEKARKEK